MNIDQLKGKSVAITCESQEQQDKVANAMSAAGCKRSKSFTENDFTCCPIIYLDEGIYLNSNASTIDMYQQIPASALLNPEPLPQHSPDGAGANIGACFEGEVKANDWAKPQDALPEKGKLCLIRRIGSIYIGHRFSDAPLTIHEDISRGCIWHGNPIKWDMCGDEYEFRFHTSFSDATVIEWRYLLPCILF